MYDQEKLREAIKFRHAVRQYSDSPIEKEKVEELKKIIDECNKDGDLHMQLVLNEPEAFEGMKSKYGKFENVRNYIAMVGKDTPDLEKRIGYFGELVVLNAVAMGLGTSWASMAFANRQNNVKVGSDEKFLCSVAVGHYANAGTPHESKPMKKLVTVKGDTPVWFKNGIDAVMMAPTFMNQQKFNIYLEGDKVTAKAERAHHSKLDLGIIKRHFEIGAGDGVWEWKEK